MAVCMNLLCLQAAATFSQLPIKSLVDIMSSHILNFILLIYGFCYLANRNDISKNFNKARNLGQSPT